MVIAHGFLVSRIGRRVTMTELGERMARAHGERRFTTGQVSEYQAGTVQSYPLEVIAAYAKATGVDAGWLAFGSESSAEAPPGVPSHYPAELPPAPLIAIPRRRKAAKKGKRA